MPNGKLVSSTGVKSEISFDRRNLSEAEKLKAAGKWVGIFLSIAIASVFVPILHFILVPAFSFAAFFVGAQAYSQKADLQNVKGKCPNCGADIQFEKLRIRKVSGEICPQCRDFLKIHIES